MRLRLLLDENLSERLLPLLAERFPGSDHIRLLGLGGAGDHELWELARRDGYVLVTKDEDFLLLSVSRGYPPKVVGLTIGNASNAATAALLLQQADVIERFAEHPEAGFLLLEPTPQPRPRRERVEPQGWAYQSGLAPHPSSSSAPPAGINRIVLRPSLSSNSSPGSRPSMAV